MAIKTIGIDLGKTVFVAVALDGRGRLVGSAQRYGRTGLVRWLANLPPCLIGMEASSGAHHLARTLQGQGHAVRLLPGQAVKPFRGAMKTTPRTRWRLPRPRTGRGYGPCRSRARRSWMCKRSIGCARSWCASAQR